MLRRGWKLSACLRDPSGRDAGAATDLEKLAREAGASAVILEMDVASDASVEGGSAPPAHRSLTVAINNAGISAMGLNEGFTSRHALALFEVNTLGAHRVAGVVNGVSRAVA